MKVLKSIGRILAVLSCIIYFFLMLGFMMLSFSMNLISGEYYSDILKNIDLKDIKISDLGEIVEIIDLDKDMNLEEVLILGLTESGIEENVATAIIENEEIRAIIGNFIGDYINYNIGGKAPTVSRVDIETIFKNPDVIDALGTTPTDDDIDEIYSILSDMLEQIDPSLESKIKEGGESW